MINDTIFLDAIKEGFWYKDQDSIKRASPSIDMYILSYTCKEDAEYYGCKIGMSMKFVNPIRNPDLRFTLENYGKTWALTKEELEEL